MNPEIETAEAIQVAYWSPSESAKQRGAKAQRLFVYPDRESLQKASGYVVVSKQPNSAYTFSVLRSELSRA